MDPAQEWKAHEKTYGGVIGLLKWAVPVTALLVLVIILLIS